MIFNISIKNNFDYIKNKRTIQYSAELLSLPMHSFLNDEEINFFTKTINNYFNQVK